MNSHLDSAKYHENEECCETVHVVSRKRKLSGREFKKLLVSRVKRVKAIGKLLSLYIFCLFAIKLTCSVMYVTDLSCYHNLGTYDMMLSLLN